MEEAKRKYDLQMFSLTNKVFNALPVAHLIQDKLFVVHGGLPAKEDFMLSDINSFDRFVVPENGSMFSQLLWSDPKATNGISPSHRGEGILWGPDISEAFLKRNDLTMIIRSHVWEPTGFKIEHNGMCVTIFSAPNYTYLLSALTCYIDFVLISGAHSPAALMNIDSNLYIEYEQFEASVLSKGPSSSGPPLLLPWKSEC